MIIDVRVDICTIVATALCQDWEGKIAFHNYRAVQVTLDRIIIL